MVGQLLAALDALPKAVVVVRVTDGVVVYANERSKRMYAAARGKDGLIGQPFRALTSEADGRDDFYAVIRGQMGAGATDLVYEADRVYPDGRRVAVRVSVQPMEQPADGELWVCVIENITAFADSRRALSRENAHLSQALSGLERRFAQVVGSGLFGVFYGRLPPSPDAGIAGANDAFVRMIGWTHDEIAAGALQIPMPIITPEGRVLAQTIVDELHADGYSAVRETEYIRKDGSRVPVLVGIALTSVNNEYIAVVIDRSDYQAKDSALRASQARFAAISRTAVVGMAISSPSGEITEVNEACARMLGYSRDEFLRERVSFMQLTPPEWTSVTLNASREVRERGFAEPYRKQLRRRDGSLVTVVIARGTLPEGGTFGLVIDVTAQQQAETALRATEDQLRQIQKMEAMGRLAGGIAHDFNNVLSVILSYSELLTDELPVGDSIREDIDEIHRAAERAARLTRQLLLFSRHEVSETKSVDLNQTLTDMSQMLERLVGEDTAIVLRPAPSLGLVHVNPAHLEQVVMNLVVNARDAMPDGGTITIETSIGAIASARDGSDQAAVVLEVSDTGTGMDSATAARIFEPFFSTKERGKGTGLGLSTVFGIVQQAGGSVTVASELGQGAKFTVALPICADQFDSPAEPAKVSEIVSDMAAKTLLLVEDESAVRRVARAILSADGYEIVDAADPVEAMGLFEEHGDRIDLVVTDVVMPRMSGALFVEKLREKSRSLPILCMSGYTDRESARQTLQDLKVAFLQKPFTPESLRRKVREVLEQSGVQA